MTLKREPLKIGLTGKLRSGKDQVADIISKQLNNVWKIGFADGITELLEEFTPRVFEEGKPRKAYQDVGQVMRGVDPDVWVRRAEKHIDTIETMLPQAHIVVKDVRQPNEVQSLRDRGFTIIKVDASPELRTARALSNNDKFDIEQMYHETELAIDKIVPDHVISNEGTLKDLEDAVESLVIDLLNTKGSTDV